MKVLMIAPQPFFSPRGTPFSVYYRTLVTTELGMDVDLLTYGEGQDVDIPGVRIIRIPRFRFLGHVKIGPSPLKLFLDLFIVVWTVALLVRRRYDYVHAHEESVFFCRFLKPIFRFKLVYDMHSSLPQQLTNFGFTKSRFLIRLFEWLEKSCVAKSDVIITICPDLADYVRSLLPDTRRHVLIENSIFDPVQMNGRDENVATASPLEIPSDRSLIVYTGTFERYQGLELLIRAFAVVHRSEPQSLLLLAGGTADQIDEMKRLADESNLNGSCVFTGQVDPTTAQDYLNRADVTISPRIEGTNTPLKVYQQLASGVPLVATRIYSHTQVLNDDVCFLVEPEPESMARGILAALGDQERRSEIVARARKLYLSKYSRPAYENKMRQVLELLR